MIKLFHQILILITLCVKIYENNIQMNVDEVYFDCYRKIQSNSKIESEKNDSYNSVRQHFIHIDKLSKKNFGIHTCEDKDKSTIELFIGYKAYDFELAKSKSNINCLIEYNEKTLEVEIGKTLILKCNCESQKNIQIKWFKDEMEINESMTNLSIEFENKKTLLQIKNLKLTDSGQYKCRFFNALSKVKLVYNVNVLGFKNPTKQILSKGETAIFDCIFYSKFSKNASFLKLIGSDHLIMNDTKIIQINEENITQLYLILSNVTLNHTGTYSCIIETTFGLLEKQFSLIVQNEFNDFCFNQSSKWSISKTIVTVIILIAISIAIYSFYKIYHRKAIYFLPMKTFKRQINNKKDNCETEMAELKTRNKFLKFKTRNENKNNTSFCYEINRKNLKIDEVILGSGYFGVVKKALYRSNLNNKKEKTVAVKMLKTNYSTSDFNKLIQELQNMSFIGYNENIVELIGFCTNNIEKEPLLIVYKYAPNGNLKNFLINQKSLGTLTDIKYFINIAYQIANGMDFISSKKCLHRDLAARNILMFPNNIIKISDFGLSKIVHNDFFKLDVNEQIPYKWLAFESLFHLIYTSKSDIWMFGVLIWEMYTLGENPYNNVQTYENLIQFLVNGNRLQKPTLCPDNIYNFMEKCWLLNQHKRPNFLDSKLFFYNQI